jgi:hypothetical protein
MAVSAIDDDNTLDDKDTWPIPKMMPAPPAIYPSGQWWTHLAAFAAKGLGAPHRTPVVTVLTPDHPSALA